MMNLSDTAVPQKLHKIVIDNVIKIINVFHRFTDYVFIGINIFFSFRYTKTTIVGEFKFNIPIY